MLVEERDGASLAPSVISRSTSSGRHGYAVAFLEGDARGRGADDADGVARDQDVGVGRLAAAVDDHVVDAVREDEQRSLGGKHAHVHAGQPGHAVSPDAAGVHDDRCVEIPFLAGLAVDRVHAGNRIALADESRDFRMEPDLAAVQFGVQHVGRAQAERVDAAVRDADGADQVGVDRGFEAPGQVRVDDLSADARLAAGVNEGLLVSEVVFREGDEQAVRLFDAVRGDLPQDHVLLDALGGGFRVVHGIARTGMQQAVVAARGAGGDVGTLDQQGPQAAHGAIPLRAGSGDAAADDDHVKFVGIVRVV